MYFFTMLSSCRNFISKLLKCIQLANRSWYSFILEHPTKSKCWSAFNWSIDEGSSCKLEHHDKSRFWSAFNWPIDEGSSFKLEHPFKSSSWSAFNWLIDEGISSKLWHCVKSSTCNFLRHNHLTIFKFLPWMKLSTIVDEASVRSTNLRLRNPFELIWDNINKLSHFFNEMPSKFSTTYHMK
jgi:hypothetical protein